MKKTTVHTRDFVAWSTLVKKHHRNEVDVDVRQRDTCVEVFRIDTEEVLATWDSMESRGKVFLDEVLLRRR